MLFQTFSKAFYSLLLHTKRLFYVTTCFHIKTSKSNKILKFGWGWKNKLESSRDSEVITAVNFSLAFTFSQHVCIWIPISLVYNVIFDLRAATRV